jgi:PilZ domain
MRRSLPRFRYRYPRHTVRIACQVVRERDFSLVADSISNLSMSGLLVTPADPALTGERLIVSFCLPRSDRWVDAEAMVTRVLHGRRPGEYSRALALQFEDLSFSSEILLASDLRDLPPAPPSSRPGRRDAVKSLQAFFRAQGWPGWASC